MRGLKPGAGGETIVVPACVRRSEGVPGPGEIEVVVEFRLALPSKEYHEAMPDWWPTAPVAEPPT